MKLTNIASLDPSITITGRKGLTGASAADRCMWQEAQNDWSQFAVESEAAIEAASVPVFAEGALKDPLPPSSLVVGGITKRLYSLAKTS